MKSVICRDFIVAVCLVSFLCYGLSMAAPRCRPGGMSCRPGRSEIPEPAVRSVFARDLNLHPNGRIFIGIY